MTAPRALVIGATGMVGSLILSRLAAAGTNPLALSRKPQPAMPGAEWIAGDLESLAARPLPPLGDVFATAPVGLVADAVPALAKAGCTRLVAFTSTSIETKWDSPDPAERAAIRQWGADEARLTSACDAHGVAWTVLRPTLIYREGVDANVSRIAGLIRRFGFFPLMGGGAGLRQPVHADDLAAAAIAAAARPGCAGTIYTLAGGETLPYREMVGRIFDGLGQPRRIVAPPLWMWRLALPLLAPLLPNFSPAMSERMAKDMAFDDSPARADLGWNPRGFRPRFAP